MQYYTTAFMQPMYWGSAATHKQQARACVVFSADCHSARWAQCIQAVGHSQQSLLHGALQLKRGWRANIHVPLSAGTC